MLAGKSPFYLAELQSHPNIYIYILYIYSIQYISIYVCVNMYVCIYIIVCIYTYIYSKYIYIFPLYAHFIICWFIPIKLIPSLPAKFRAKFNGFPLHLPIKLTESTSQLPQFLPFSINPNEIPFHLPNSHGFFHSCSMVFHDFPKVFQSFPWFSHGFSMEKSLVSMVFLWKNPSHGVMPISNISGPFTMPPPTPKRPANLRKPWKNHRKTIEN